MKERGVIFSRLSFLFQTGFVLDFANKIPGVFKEFSRTRN